MNEATLAVSMGNQFKKLGYSSSEAMKNAWAVVRAMTSRHDAMAEALADLGICSQCGAAGWLLDNELVVSCFNCGARWLCIED